MAISGKKNTHLEQFQVNFELRIFFITEVTTLFVFSLLQENALVTKFLPCILSMMVEDHLHNVCSKIPDEPAHEVISIIV